MTYWVNVYEDGGIGGAWTTREIAAEWATMRKALYRIKVTLKGKA